MTTTATMSRYLDRCPMYLAVHEAAHAVVLLVELPDYIAVPFDRVVIRTPRERLAVPYVDRKGREGHCQGVVEGADHGSVGLWHHLQQKPQGSDAMIESWRACVWANGVSSCAGMIAEARSRHWSVTACLLDGGQKDFEHVKAVAWCLSDGQNDREVIRRMERRAKELVWQHWGVILAVAEQLVLKRSLDDEQVRATLVAAKRS